MKQRPADIGADLAARLARHASHSLPDPLPAEASLTQQLGVDSLVLMAFLSDVRADYDLDLGGWLVGQAARGRDTLGTLTAHIIAQSPVRAPAASAQARFRRPTSPRQATGGRRR